MREILEQLLTPRETTAVDPDRQLVEVWEIYRHSDGVDGVISLKEDTRIIAVSVIPLGLDANKWHKGTIEILASGHVAFSAPVAPLIGCQRDLKISIPLAPKDTLRIRELDCFDSPPGGYPVSFVMLRRRKAR